MNKQEIIKSVRNGNRVYWKNDCYTVIEKTKGEFFVRHSNGSLCGLFDVGNPKVFGGYDLNDFYEEKAISLDSAKAFYVYRYTLDNIPDWSFEGMPDKGKYYAPHYVSDIQWYQRTTFFDEGKSDYCNSERATWPMGKWLKWPLMATDGKGVKYGEFYNKELEVDVSAFLESLLFAYDWEDSELNEVDYTIYSFCPEFVNFVRKFIAGFKRFLGARDIKPYSYERSFGGNCYFSLSGHGVGFFYETESGDLDLFLNEYSGNAYLFEGLSLYEENGKLHVEGIDLSKI